METFVSKVKRKTEKNKSTFFANLNAPSPTTRIPRLQILNDLLSGKKKTVCALRLKGVKMVTRFSIFQNRPSRKSRLRAEILKRKVPSGKFRFCRTSDWFCWDKMLTIASTRTLPNRRKFRVRCIFEGIHFLKVKRIKRQRRLCERTLEPKLPCTKLRNDCKES